jgi:mono/diheme cytochrome c family protein
MLYAITTTGKVGLLIVAGLFIAWALITAMWIPKRNPDFPVTLTGFLLVSSIFLVLQLGTVYWVTTTQEVETEEAAPAESTPGETTPTESTPTESTSTEETTTEGTSTEGTSTEGTSTEETTTGEAEGQGDAAAGKEVFTSAGCVGCHTLADAGATGTVGPNLDEAKPSHDLVVERVTNGKGPMPPFKGQLSEKQIQDVAAYVSSVAGKS